MILLRVKALATPRTSPHAPGCEGRKERSHERSFLLDVLKAIGCVLIVLHHLAFYSPMADVVATRWPTLIYGLSEHARLAVQMFLVCSGFLTAAALAQVPQLGGTQALGLLVRRYRRLALPLLAALSVTVLLSEALRPHFDHASLSAPPSLGQALAHVFFLQNLFGMEALSAGVWYVAIDLQLYMLALLLWWGSQQLVRWRPICRLEVLRLWLVASLTLLSLLRWNLDTDLDLYGIYFFGAYGLGWLAWRARRSRWVLKGWLLLFALGLLATWVDPRWRISTAWFTALLLAAAPQAWMQVDNARSARWQAVLGRLARMSYSVFVIHFAVGLLVSAAWVRAWPQSLWANAVGMALALVLALVAAALLHHCTEKARANTRQWLGWTLVFLASAVLAGVWAAQA